MENSEISNALQWNSDCTAVKSKSHYIVASENNKRIAKNTLLLYVRMLLLIIVQLYTVPVVLKALGVEDYGIYNVVAGVVTMFSFIGGSLASGSQRFIAFELGKKNKERLKYIFDVTISIYIILAIIAFILLEAGGYYFLNNNMNIPANRLCAANWVFQLTILAFIINLISIPYNAAVIAHEKMSIFAYVSILECFLKLITVIILQFVLFDHLIVYSLLICFITIIIRIIYQVYCRKQFDECRNFKFVFDLYKSKDLLIYSWWNMIGSVALISRQQGLNIIINLFFGPLLNAAHSIGQQINGVLSQFINNVYMATRPQMTKLYANNEIKEMWSLVFHSSKLAFYLLMVLSIPLLLELDEILIIWLYKVPPYTSTIGKLMIISILIETLANQIIGAYQAQNKIKRYQVYSSTIILLNIPISYISILYFSNPIIPYVISVLLSVLYVCSIIWNARKELNMNIEEYVKQVILNVVVVYCFSILIVWSCIKMLEPSFLRILVTCIISLSASSLIIWLIGLDKTEKDFIIKVVKQKLCK